MLTSSIYSNGINADRIIDDDFDTWVDWCDETVDGYKRCQLNIIFDSVSTLDEALQNVENCGRAKIIRRGTKISVNVDKPKTSSALFGLGNIVPGSEHVRWLRQSERSDAVEIRYRDINSDYSENTIFKPSENYNSLARPPRVVSLFIPGINNKEQAEREALLRQQISDSIKKSVEFQSGLEAIPVVSGDVFNYQASINSFSGRLPLSNNRAESWTSSTIYLDQEINLDSTVFSGNCIIMIRDPDDTLQSYTVSGPFDTDTWTVTISTTTTFNYLSPYTICRSTGDVYQYKISKMSRTNKLDFRIEGLQYSSTAYYNINYAGGSTAI